MASEGGDGDACPCGAAVNTDISSSSCFASRKQKVGFQVHTSPTALHYTKQPCLRGCVFCSGHHPWAQHCSEC